jgi:hypothetical protein
VTEDVITQYSLQLPSQSAQTLNFFEQVIIQNFDFINSSFINEITEFIKWSFFSAPLTISGRNISLVNDNWRSGNFISVLDQDSSMYKLRRDKNDKKI